MWGNRIFMTHLSKIKLYEKYDMLKMLISFSKFTTDELYEKYGICFWKDSPFLERCDDGTYRCLTKNHLKALNNIWNLIKLKDKDALLTLFNRDCIGIYVIERIDEIKKKFNIK